MTTAPALAPEVARQRKDISMATDEEIERRVEDTDTPRTAKRSTAAKRVSDLAQRRATIAEQLDDIERELGDVLADAQEVMGVDELARFTDVPAADLTRWLTGRKTTRTKRKKPAASTSDTRSDTSREPSAARTPTASQASTLTETPAPRNGTADAPARVTAEVT